MPSLAGNTLWIFFKQKENQGDHPISANDVSGVTQSCVTAFFLPGIACSRRQN
jgi:hypothetical protein